MADETPAPQLVGPGAPVQIDMASPPVSGVGFVYGVERDAELVAAAAGYLDLLDHARLATDPASHPEGAVFLAGTAPRDLRDIARRMVDNERRLRARLDEARTELAQVREAQPLRQLERFVATNGATRLVVDKVVRGARLLTVWYDEVVEGDDEGDDW